MFIDGANNPGNRAYVDNEGHVLARSKSISEQTDAAQKGQSFNFNTGTLTLTTDTESSLFYVKNNEDQDIVISRVFVTMGPSTGGAGKNWSAKIVANPTGGTVISAGTDKAPQNFNFGSSQTLDSVAKVGGQAFTCTGGSVPVEFLFPSDAYRTQVPFESIVLPRGSSLCFSVTPPAGNTSVVIQAGLNAYLLKDI